MNEMGKIKEGYKETEIGVIPNEWNALPIGEVIEYLKSGLSRKLSDSDIGIPCLRSSNIIDGKLSLNDLKYWYIVDPQGANIKDYILDQGDILVNFINSIAQIGKACIFKNTSMKAIYTTNIFRVKVNPQKVENEYFFYNTQTKSYEYQVSLITKPAVNQASFTTGDFKNIIFPIPLLPEQQRIAEILSATDEHIEKLDKTIEDYQLLKKGMMKKLLTEGIGHTEFKDTEIGRIPKAWEVKKISEVMNIQIGGTPSRNVISYWDTNKTTNNVWVSIKDLSSSNKYIVDSTEYISNEGVRNSNVKLVKPNTVIMSFKLTIGVVAITKAQMYTNEAIVAFTNDECIINHQFLYYILPNLQYDTDEAIKGKTLNKQKINNTFIFIPSIKEQVEMASILSEIDTRLDLYQQQREDFIQLKKALMEQLLTGKLRVTQ